MTRGELLERLKEIRDLNNDDQISAADVCELIENKIASLVEDINLDGVLDVQCPPEIAKDMNLPRPAEHPTA